MANEEAIKMFNEQFDQLAEKLSQPEYINRGYEKGASVTIPGTLFAEINDFLGTVKSLAEGLEKTALSMTKVTEYMQDEVSKFVLRFMEAHVANIDAGNTVDKDTLDQQDAIEKIQEIKEN